MLKSLAKVLGFIACLALQGGAYAVGMGGINVATALGEPLKAEIELSDVGKADKNKISARLATPEAFKDAGLDYPGALPKLKFQVETRASGEPYIKVTSAQPLNEPFVSLLVELTWPAGKLLREYTFLLDPPGFKAEQPKAAQVQPLEPSVTAAGEPKVPAAKEEPKLTPTPAPVPAMEKAPAAAKPAAAGNVATGTITVKRGDTLSKIARETKLPEVSLERMLVAMYRANESEFDGNNMNRIRTGKVLRLPEQNELNKAEQSEAVKEIRVQAADWHAYRQRLAAASGPAMEQGSKQETSGKISATVADKTPPAKESAKEVVRLSKGEAPGDKTTGGGNTKALQDKLHAMEEEATARNKMLKDSNERIVLLEKNIKEMQRLLELKTQAAPAAKPAETKPAPAPAKPAAPAAVAVTSPVSVSAIAPASTVAQAKPVKKPVPKAPPPPPPSMLDQILDEPLYLAGSAAALLGVGGIAFMLSRRRGKKAGESAEEAGVGTYITAPVAPSPDTGDYTQAAAAVQRAEEPADVDPISEADLFLNFGRDAQAEEILKDALNKNPGNQQVRLKLLSIYANRNDAKTFAAVAQEVHDSGDAAAWAQAAEMGRRVDPANPLYGGSGEEASAAAPQEEATITQSSSALDFDLGLGMPEAAVSSQQQDETAATSTNLDFDLGVGATEEAAPVAEAAGEEAKEEKAEAPSALDFDIGLGGAEAVPAETTPAAPEAALDFDITSEHETFSPEAAEQAEPAPAAEESMFDVTAPNLSPVATEEAAPAEKAPEEKEEALEFTLDFPVPEPAEEEKAAPAAAMDLGDISLDIGSPAPAPAPAPAAPVEEVKDARWHDVATKLDLARAYQEMGDAAGAKEILDEVLNEGDAQQKAAARAMLQQL